VPLTEKKMKVPDQSVAFSFSSDSGRAHPPLNKLLLTYFTNPLLLNMSARYKNKCKDATVGSGRINTDALFR